MGQAGAAAVTPSHAGVGAKVLGAVGIIFGAVALATFWLPVLGGLIGWTGIVAGGLGLIVAIVGLVVAAMSHGAGLLWNVAGASGSAVGLVLAVVLGISFGLFTARAAPELPVVVQRPALPPVDRAAASRTRTARAAAGTGVDRCRRVDRARADQGDDRQPRHRAGADGEF